MISEVRQHASRLQNSHPTQHWLNQPPVAPSLKSIGPALHQSSAHSLPPPSLHSRTTLMRFHPGKPIFFMASSKPTSSTVFVNTSLPGPACFHARMREGSNAPVPSVGLSLPPPRSFGNAALEHRMVCKFLSFQRHRSTCPARILGSFRHLFSNA